jgi:hypothetical protein
MIFFGAPWGPRRGAQYLCVSCDFGGALISDFHAVEATSPEMRHRSIELSRRHIWSAVNGNLHLGFARPRYALAMWWFWWPPFDDSQALVLWLSRCSGMLPTSSRPLRPRASTKSASRRPPPSSST